MAATGLLLCTMQAVAADPSAELLARIRQRMVDNLARLPNYTCLETIERRAGPVDSRRLALIDRLRLEVAYVGRRELYAWPGAKRFEEKPIDEIVGRGAAIGLGSFALHAQAIFHSNAPEFSWAGESEQNGRKTVRFDFRVSREKSQYAILTGTAPVIVAYRGFLEADAQTLALLRLELRAPELPAELQLRSAGEAMEYQPRRIGDSDFLLPVISELSTVTTDGELHHNVTRLESCHQYAGASTVRFDVVENDARAAQPSAPIEVPADLTLETRLRDTIDNATAARGDVVYATVAADVKKSGVVIVPKGAVLTGRITQLETHTQRGAVYLGVGLLFHTIEFSTRRGEFSAGVEEAGIGPSYVMARNRQTGEKLLYVKGQSERLPAGTRLVLRTK